MEMNFCRRCGTKLESHQGNSYTCASGHTIYLNPSPTVGIYFLSEDNTKVLLAVRGIEPDKGMLDSVGGFLDEADDFESAARRELQEELGLEPNEYEPLVYLATGAGTYDMDNEVSNLATVGYWTRLKTNRELVAADDIASVEWHDLHDVDMERISGEEIPDAIRALQAKFPKEER